MAFRHKHILGTRDLSRDDLQMILDTADSFCIIAVFRLA
jgi:aspartate carbamoyltransferase catalytic subunit